MEVKVSEIKARARKTIQYVNQKEKKDLKKQQQMISELWNNFKQSNILIIKVLEQEPKKQYFKK